MRNAETRKTRWEPSKNRRWVKRLLIALVVLFGIAYLWWQLNMQQQAVGLAHHTFYVSIMRTPDELARGLSGTKNLAVDHGMLFVFPNANESKIWMKDMNYPIDIVWLNDERVVVHVEKNVSPSSYPKIFQSDTPARYVIELPSGTIDRTGIIPGDPAGFPSGV